MQVQEAIERLQEIAKDYPDAYITVGTSCGDRMCSGIQCQESDYTDDGKKFI